MEDKLKERFRKAFITKHGFAPTNRELADTEYIKTWLKKHTTE